MSTDVNGHSHQGTGPRGGQFTSRARTAPTTVLTGQPDQRERLAVVVADFLRESSDARIWARYPDVSEQEDECTDEMDCLPMSRLFADRCREAGLNPVLVHGQEGWAGEDEVWTHWWVRFPGEGGQDVNVDWTVRQFHNLQDPPDMDDMQVPTVWRGDGHPLVTFEVETSDEHW